MVVVVYIAVALALIAVPARKAVEPLENLLCPADLLAHN
jgi:hypothetical protein